MTFRVSISHDWSALERISLQIHGPSGLQFSRGLTMGEARSLLESLHRALINAENDAMTRPYRSDVPES